MPPRTVGGRPSRLQPRGRHGSGSVLQAFRLSGGISTGGTPADEPLIPGGLTPRQVFLSGGNPLDPGTWLRTGIFPSAQGLFLGWNPQPGHTYQVQSSTDLRTWINLGSPRFAVGTEDSIYLGGSSRGYYRILCLH